MTGLTDPSPVPIPERIRGSNRGPTPSRGNPRPQISLLVVTIDGPKHFGLPLAKEKRRPQFDPRTWTSASRRKPVSGPGFSPETSPHPFSDRTELEVIKFYGMCTLAVNCAPLFAPMTTTELGESR